MNKPTHYVIKNWKEFQHYKDRNPPWIKLHFALLSSEDWTVLDDASRVLAIACMLIGSKDDGRIPNNPKYMQRVAYLNSLPDFGPLLECGFLQVVENIEQHASNTQASASDCLQSVPNARPETETETEKSRGETKKRKKPPKSPKGDVSKKLHSSGLPVELLWKESFEDFWDIYPKKRGKETAKKSWDNLNGDEELYYDICNAVIAWRETEDWQKNDGQFIPNASTFLNQKRWQDEIPPPKPINRADPEWMAANDDYTAVGGTKGATDEEYDALAAIYGWYDKDRTDE